MGRVCFVGAAVLSGDGGVCVCCLVAIDAGVRSYPVNKDRGVVFGVEDELADYPSQVGVGTAIPVEL